MIIGMRRLRRVITFIALGTASTFAVSWMFAAFQHVPMYGGTPAATSPRPYVSAFIWHDRAWSINGITGIGYADHWWTNLLVDVPPDSPLRGDNLALVSSWGARVNESAPEARVRSTSPSWGTFARTTPPPDRDVMGSDSAFGWPWPCLWYQVRGEVINNATANNTLYGGLHLRGVVDTRGRDFHALPLRPIWPALLASIALYSAVWWMLLSSISTIRCRSRRRRGACLSCGYDLRGAYKAGCPECGWERDDAHNALSSSHAP